MVNNRNWRAAHSWVGEHWFEFATDGFYHHGCWGTAPQRRSLVMIVTTNNDDQPMVKPLSQFLPIFQNIMTFLHCWWESGLMYSNFFGELQWRFSLLSCRPCLFPIISAHTAHMAGHVFLKTFRECETAITSLFGCHHSHGLDQGVSHGVSLGFGHGLVMMSITFIRSFLWSNVGSEVSKIDFNF